MDDIVHSFRLLRNVASPPRLPCARFTGGITTSELPSAWLSRIRRTPSGSAICSLVATGRPPNAAAPPRAERGR
jgi:hypothetical protein